MTTLKEKAENYEQKKTANIADLDSFDVSEPVEEREGTDKDGKTFEYSVLIRDDKEYRVPNGVLKTIKSVLAANAKHGKDVTSFSVEKTGSGLDTEYQVITLE